jgi:hypothetical protein
MKHHIIRTVFGNSWTQNKGTFPHGNGQGNGNGPAVWAAISLALLLILRCEGYSTTTVVIQVIIVSYFECHWVRQK